MSDPRFDPRYQRGYSGPQPVPSASPPAAPAPTLRVAPPPAVLPEERQHPVSEAASAADVEYPDAAIETPRRNPYALTMLVAGVLLLVAGGATIWSSATRIDSSTAFDAQAQAISMLSYLLPPALLAGGFFSIVGWLVLGALGVRTGRDR